MPEDFASRMASLAEAIVKRAGGCRNEEQTKQSLIQPVIHVLGYDIFDPSEVVMEYACDAPVLKTRSGKPESVDYAIRIANCIAILVEAKDTGENLDRHGGQLARYFMATECRHAVLTNGLEWRFFSDLDRDNVMDEDPYRIIDMRSLSTDDIEFLSGFRKEGFSEEELRSEAERAMYASKISDYIKSNIIDDMADDIVRIIVGHVYDGVRSAAVLARFKPMISEEFDKCISDKYAVRSSLVKKTGGYVEELPSADPEPQKPASQPTFPIEVFYAARDKSFAARALYLGGNRIKLLAGSTVAPQERSYLTSIAKEARRKYVDENHVVTEDVTFDSASTAGAVVNGMTCDAGRQWKVADGRTILDFLGGETWGEASRIMPVASPAASHALTEAPAETDGGVQEDSEFPIFMRTRHVGTPTSYDVTATYLGHKRCRLLLGGQCAKTCDAYTTETTRRLRDEHLDENGIVIKELEDTLHMVGTVVRGSTCDGTRRWKLRDGREIREVLSQGDTISAILDDGFGANDAEDAGSTTSWPVRMSYVSTNREFGLFSATALVSEDGSVVVEAGSVVSATMTQAVSKITARTRHAELDGLEANERGSVILPHDVRFDSASTAACFVCGSSVSGNYAWRDDQGRKLGDLK